MLIMVSNMELFLMCHITMSHLDQGLYPIIFMYVFSEGDVCLLLPFLLDPLHQLVFHCHASFSASRNTPILCISRFVFVMDVGKSEV